MVRRVDRRSLTQVLALITRERNHMLDVRSGLESSGVGSCVRNSSTNTREPLFSSLFAQLPHHVSIYEVGPRDGLQNEPAHVSTSTKLALIHGLAATGLKRIETTSFVSARKVPQLSDASELMGILSREQQEGTSKQPITEMSPVQRAAASQPARFSVLVPNLKGFEAAMASGASEVAIFASASEAFSHANINCSIEESLTRFRPVLKAAALRGVPVRGYVSCVVGCPYSGHVEPSAAAAVAHALYDMGCYEISMGDTTGVGTAGSMARMWEAVTAVVPHAHLAAHCHDTYGQAIANVLVSLQCGITTIDSSIAGLGGCPYAQGATGNVATEDVVFLLDGLGVTHGVEWPALLRVGTFICQALGRGNSSKAAAAVLASIARQRQDKLRSAL